uniref:Uncharacterized protein n=1 Tax=Caenorhabditis japonica TaxID=281687 RepID=A0A8R1IR67_CAEJA
MSNADSNDSSYVEREIRPAQARLMTHGEAVTLLRMIDTISPNCSRSPLPPSSRTFPYGKDSIEEVINHVFPRYTDPGKMMTPELIKEIRRYYLVNGLNMEEMLKSIRRHSVRLVEFIIFSSIRD